MPFGIAQISEKKMSVLSNKKIDKNGAKIRFPTRDMIERGSPHVARKGRETRVATSCALR